MLAKHTDAEWVAAFVRDAQEGNVLISDMRILYNEYTVYIPVLRRMTTVSRSVNLRKYVDACTAVICSAAGMDLLAMPMYVIPEGEILVKFGEGARANDMFDNKNIIIWAIETGDENLALRTIERFPEMASVAGEFNDTPLAHAVIMGMPRVVARLCEMRKVVEAPKLRPRSYSSVVLGARGGMRGDGRCKSVGLEEKKDAGGALASEAMAVNVNCTVAFGGTVLHWSGCCRYLGMPNSVEIWDLLVQAGAKSIPNGFGLLPSDLLYAYQVNTIYDNKLYYSALGDGAKFHCFYGKTVFSQFYYAPFTCPRTGLTVPTAEHWLHYHKAMLFEDYVTAQKMLAIDGVSSASRIRQLGKTVRGYKEDVWQAKRFEIALEGNILKFGQNPELLRELLATGDLLFAETSSNDLIWGTGIAIGNPGYTDWKMWKGTNLLGKVLDKTKEWFMR